MPDIPNIISGIARKGPFQGISIVSSTIVDGGQEINIYVSDGTEFAESETITLTHTSSEEELTATVNSSGEFTFDLANLPSYTSGDAFTLTLDTRDDKEDDNQGISKTVAVDREEKIHDENYPLPVSQVVQLNSHPFVKGNVQRDFVITRSDGQPDSETVTFADGSSYKMDFSYNSSNRLIRTTRWIKQ